MSATSLLDDQRSVSSRQHPDHSLFFRKFVVALAEWADVTLVFNEGVDTEVQPLSLPADIIALTIARRIAPFRDLVCLVKLFGKSSVRGTLILSSRSCPKPGFLPRLPRWRAGSPRLHIFQGEVWSSKSGSCGSSSRLVIDHGNFQHGITGRQCERENISSMRKWSAPRASRFSGRGRSPAWIPRCSDLTDARREWRTALASNKTNALFCFWPDQPRQGRRELIDAGRRLLRDVSDLKIAFVGPDEGNLIRSMESDFGSQLRARVICPGLTRTPENG